MGLMKKAYWSAIIFLGSAGPILAVQTITPATGTVIDLGRIEGWVEDIVDFILRMGTLLAIGYIVWAGIKWMRAGGDEKAVGEAKIALKNGVIGAAIVLGVYVILKTIRAFLTTGSL